MRRHSPRKRRKREYWRMRPFNKSDCDLGERSGGKNMAKLKYTSSRVTSRYRPATTRLGSTLRRSEGSLGRTRPSNTAPGAISSSSWDSSRTPVWRRRSAMPLSLATRWMVKDATADYSDEEMHAALDVNIPNYASAIVKTDEVVHLTLFSKCRVQ